MGSQTIRVPINVKIYDAETKELILSSSSTIKSKIRNLTSEALAQNANVRGLCTITYSKAQDSMNAFEFYTMEEYDEKMEPLLEIGLLRELKASGMLEKKYLG